MTGEEMFDELVTITQRTPLVCRARERFTLQDIFGIFAGLNLNFGPEDGIQVVVPETSLPVWNEMICTGEGYVRGWEKSRNLQKTHPHNFRSYFRLKIRAIGLGFRENRLYTLALFGDGYHMLYVRAILDIGTSEAIIQFSREGEFLYDIPPQKKSLAA